MLMLRLLKNRKSVFSIFFHKVHSLIRLLDGFLQIVKINGAASTQT